MSERVNVPRPRHADDVVTGLLIAGPVSDGLTLWFFDNAVAALITVATMITGTVTGQVILSRRRDRNGEVIEE